MKGEVQRRALRRPLAAHRLARLGMMLLALSTGLQRTASGQAVPDSTRDFLDDHFLNESREDFDARMQWWRDARFGMFIHWGDYAVAAGMYKGRQVTGDPAWMMDEFGIPIEEYEQYARQFNPARFDAREWVRTAKDAGVKYIVITSKHHDGFAIFDSEVSDFDVMDASPFGRDILAELSAASREAGIPLGFYYSIMDWHHPDAQAPHFPTYNTKKKSNPNFQRYITTYLKPQVRELVEKYDPVLLWFDGDWIPEYTHTMGLDLYAFVRELKPEILVNNRVDTGRKGKQGMNADDQAYAGDFGTPEQQILGGTSSFDWETCMTMNDSWGYNANDHNWKSAETLIHQLVDVVAKGGNYLLNVGPTAEGVFPEPSVERLNAMGDWLAINGEAIYGSRPWTAFGEGKGIRYTSVGDSIVYAISPTWPGDTLTLKQVQPAPSAVITLLGDDESLSWTYDETAGLTITLPGRLMAPSDHPGKYAWVFRIPIR